MISDTDIGSEDEEATEIIDDDDSSSEIDGDAALSDDDDDAQDTEDYVDIDSGDDNPGTGVGIAFGALAASAAFAAVFAKKRK